MMTNADDIDRSVQAFRDAEIANLRAWARLSGREKIEFFEEMIELAYHSGALQPDRLALRDAVMDDKTLQNQKSTRPNKI